MNNNRKKIITSAIFLFLFLSPVFAYAVEATQPAGSPGTGITYECVDGNCDFNDLVRATNKVVDFGRNFALLFSVVVIAYAGFLYMTSEGNPGKLAEANKMFVSVGKGIIFVMAAWLIVHLITNSLLRPEVSTIIPNG
ncbi:MAG: hypothetical protein HY507_00900 [Candidatus Zambryskibacteria bacterium]|nr:hypothetical protein [Candidatus Zambryskibacteria bacterium]